MSIYNKNKITLTMLLKNCYVTHYRLSYNVASSVRFCQCEQQFNKNKNKKKKRQTL